MSVTKLLLEQSSTLTLNAALTTIKTSLSVLHFMFIKKVLELLHDMDHHI